MSSSPTKELHCYVLATFHNPIKTSIVISVIISVACMCFSVFVLLILVIATPTIVFVLSHPMIHLWGYFCIFDMRIVALDINFML